MFKISYLQEFLKKLQEKSFEKFAYIGKLLYLCSDFQPRFPKKTAVYKKKNKYRVAGNVVSLARTRTL